MWQNLPLHCRRLFQKGSKNTFRRYTKQPHCIDKQNSSLFDDKLRLPHSCNRNKENCAQEFYRKCVQPWFQTKINFGHGLKQILLKVQSRCGAVRDVMRLDGCLSGMLASQARRWAINTMNYREVKRALVPVDSPYSKDVPWSGGIWTLCSWGSSLGSAPALVCQEPAERNNGMRLNKALVFICRRETDPLI